MNLDMILAKAGGYEKLSSEAKTPEEKEKYKKLAEHFFEVAEKFEACKKGIREEETERAKDPYRRK